MSSVSWTSTTNGTWSTGANWSNGAPMRGDDVTINPAGAAVTVTYTTGTTILDSLTTGAGDTLDVTGGTLAVLNGYNITGPLVVNGGFLHLESGNYGATIGNSLTMTGGSLAFDNSVTLAGNVALNAGSTTFNGNGVAQGSIFSQAAPNTITIAHGSFTDAAGSSALNGTIAGAGEMIFAGNGTTVLQSKFALSTGAADIASGTVLLQENLSYAHNFSLYGTLDLASNTVTLSGHVALDGDLNGGALVASGNGHLNGLILDNGASLTLTTSFKETGNIQLGGNTGTGTLNVASSGTLRIAGNDSIFQGSNGGSLINSGLIEKTAGGSISGTTYILDAVTSTGIIQANVGIIDFRAATGGAASTLTGTLAGAGGISFDNGSYVLGSTNSRGPSLALTSGSLIFGGSTSSTNVTLASALSYGGNWQQTGALLLLENTLTLSGISAWDGGELKGTATVIDNGTLHLGAGMDLEGNLAFDLNGAVDQTGGINLGALSDSVDTAILNTGETWMLEGGSSIYGAYGTITTLAGSTFEKLDGAQTSVVQSQVINNGTLIVNTGTLALSGQGTLGGSLSGSAALDISGQFTLAAGLSLSVGELILDAPSQTNDIQASLAGNLTYANDFAQEGGTLALNGNTLTLSGGTSLDTGAILGSGEVLVTGAATIDAVALNQGATVQFDGVTEQTGNVLLTGGQTAPALIIGTGGSYSMDNNLYIGGPNNSVVGTMTVESGGTLSAGGAGLTTIAATVNNNGAIHISHGEMQFLGPLEGTGSISLAAGGVLDIDSNVLTQNTITFGAGGGLLYLQNANDFTGKIAGFATGDAVELNGFAFVGASIQTVSGDSVTISESSGPSITLNFTTAQTQGSLFLGVGEHGGLALIHS